MKDKLHLKTELISEKVIKIPTMLEIREFKQIRYPGKRPCLNTLRKWIQTGVLQGEIKDGMYFVDISLELMSTGDKLLDQIIEL